MSDRNRIDAGGEGRFKVIDDVAERRPLVVGAADQAVDPFDQSEQPHCSWQPRGEAVASRGIQTTSGDLRLNSHASSLPDAAIRRPAVS